MRHSVIRSVAILLAIGFMGAIGIGTAHADWLVKNGWDGKRRISYQQQKDLFYNYYAPPGPCDGGAAAGIYPCPRPVPPNVGWTWVTYQPFMPHEMLYKHERSYYTYNPGAGWTRTNVRYGTAGLRWNNWCADLHYPRTDNIWPVSNGFFYPGLRF